MATTLLNERYAVLDLLGQGGMGAVYRAQDHALARPVAIKERTADPSSAAGTIETARAQFRREAQALAQLAHPNLPRIYDYFSLDGNEYIVMELIEGTNLSEFVQTRGALPESLVLHWARQILDALIFLHGRSIIHRDIKPNNLILTPDERVVLVDFGLSKLYDPNSQHTSTTLRGVGTPEYAPLEQYAREVGRTDPRTDVYALGATLYRFLAGKPPMDVHARLLNPDCMRSLRELNPTVSFGAAAAIDKAMALYPQARYQTALDFQQGLGITGWSRLGKPVDSRSVGAGIVVASAPGPLAPAFDSPPPSEPMTNARALPPQAGHEADTETARMPLALAAAPPEGDEPNEILTPPNEPTRADEPPPSAEWSPAAESELTRTFDSPTQLLVKKSPLALKLVRGILQLELAPGIRMEFVRVPAGKFLMGSLLEDDPLAQRDEMPHHAVTLDEYWIGKCAVSVAQYTVFTDATARQPPFDFPAKNRYPVVNVSWFDASIFGQWLSQASGKTLRLPTEAEWEKAARGADGQLYPWGDEFDAKRLNSAEGGRGGTTPIDAYAAGVSPFGALDLVGNVWEWTADWYEPNYYSVSPAESPAGPETGHYKALRGGAWFSDRAHVRAADRTHFNPENHYDYVGFRCVLVPDLA